MCIRDSLGGVKAHAFHGGDELVGVGVAVGLFQRGDDAVSYTHLRAHETVLDLVCRLLLEKKKLTISSDHIRIPNSKDLPTNHYHR